MFSLKISANISLILSFISQNSQTITKYLKILSYLNLLTNSKILKTFQMIRSHFEYRKINYWVKILTNSDGIVFCVEFWSELVNVVKFTDGRLFLNSRKTEKKI